MKGILAEEHNLQGWERVYTHTYTPSTHVLHVYLAKYQKKKNPCVSVSLHHSQFPAKESKGGAGKWEGLKGNTIKAGGVFYYYGWE